MNNKSKKILYLEKILRFMATAVIKIRKPKIVGITGSVGKTSTKEAVYLVLSQNFKTRKNEENYNNEIGVPLTIIGAKTGGKNPFKWLWVLVRWFFALICPWGYPKILVLELAIDRPGDMEYLVDFIPVDVGILTNISASHLEFFEDINSIAREKSILIKSVSGNGLAIVNNDNEIIRKIKEKLDVKVIDFGIKNKSKILASDINFNYDDKEEKLRGLSFKLNYEGNFLPIRLHHIIAKHHIYSVLAAVAVGNYFKINFIDAAKSLEKIMPPDGRMKLVDGFMDKSIIVDDTYNSSPVSAKAALETLEDTLAKRRVAVLGDMLELGSYSKQGHKEVIREVLGRDFEKLVIVGRKMKEAKDSICAKEDCESKIIYFETPDEAGDFLRRNMQIGDLILVKGSQSMRMEKVVEKIMKNPSDADKILCRQSKKWKNKKFQVV